MLFDTTFSENIVIVPPKPDAFLSCHEDFSYSNLYSYNNVSDDCHGGAPPSPGAATASTAPASSVSMNAPASACSSSTTLSSSFTSTSAASFDSSVFDAAARNGRGNANNNAANNSNNTITNANTAANANPNSKAITRDPRNGAFTFQVHAEYDLLLHVQKDLDKHRRNNPNNTIDNALTDVDLSKAIMRSIDGYCLKKQWMYHIGSQKGVAIGRFLRAGVESYLKVQGQQRRAAGSSGSAAVKKFVCVELGTYCGYSALVLASTLRQFILDQKQQQQQSSSSPTEPFEFHIYTTEVSTKLLNVAQSVFRLAKMETHITPILIKSHSDSSSSNSNSSCGSSNNSSSNKQQSLSQSLKQVGVSNIDFLLLDHAKNLYLNDLQDLERAELLRAGSYVSADNVVFNRLDAYRDHMHKLGLRGVVESHLEEMNLEYSNNLKDGMEMTVYLKDPPVTKN